MSKFDIDTAYEEQIAHLEIYRDYLTGAEVISLYSAMIAATLSSSNTTENELNETLDEIVNLVEKQVKVLKAEFMKGAKITGNKN